MFFVFNAGQGKSSHNEKESYKRAAHLEVHSQKAGQFILARGPLCGTEIMVAALPLDRVMQETNLEWKAHFTLSTRSHISPGYFLRPLNPVVMRCTWIDFNLSPHCAPVSSLLPRRAMRVDYEQFSNTQMRRQPAESPNLSPIPGFTRCDVGLSRVLGYWCRHTRL
jgi:hypothetical protein